MHCPNCGQEIIEGSEFCGNCGTPVVHQPVGTTCARCGSLNLPEAEFCAECGARLGGEAVPMQSFCPECGEPLSPGAAFCGNCGRILQPQPQPQQQNWEPVQTQQQDWAPQPQAQAQPQKSSMRKMLMATAVAVVLLVIGITGFWKPGFLLDMFRPTAKLENGMLALNDISLDFKQTNLKNGEATLTTVKDKEYEIQSGLIGDLYVMNVDKSCQGKVTVSVPVPKDFKPTTGNGRYIKLGIGRDYKLEDGKTARRYSYFDAEIKDGKAVTVIDPAVLGQSLTRHKASAKPAENKAPDMGEFKEYVGWFYKEGLFLYGEGYQNSKGHFRLWYDYNPTRYGQLVTGDNIYMTAGDAKNLLSDLEEAYNYYKTHGYAEHVDTYTPIDVYITRQWKLVRKLLGKGEGTEGTWDPLTGNIELNEEKILDEKGRYEGEQRNKARATIYHEVFHAVQQSLIGGRDYIRNTKNSNWFDEATGTNFERLVIPGLTNNEQDCFWSLWQGPIPEGCSATEGYSRGLLINYMSSKLGGDAWIKDCYENWSSDYGWLKAYMKLIAPTEADFAAKFYMEVIRNRKLVPFFDVPSYYNSSRTLETAEIKRYVSSIRLKIDDKTKEKINKGEEDAFPIVFKSPSFELGAYGGRVVGLIIKDKDASNNKVVNFTEAFPDKCQLKLEAEGGCRIQIIEFTGEKNSIVKGTIIKNFKEQLNKGYKYIVLVTSTQPKKQKVVLKATLEKEELKEGIYNGKATMTQGKRSQTANNKIGFRLSKEKDGRWSLNICKANGDYFGTAPNVPLTYDAKEKIWKGHRKFKENFSNNPNKAKEEVSDIHCTMKVNMEGKEPILIVDYKVKLTKLYGNYKSFSNNVQFEGKWSSELKGKTIGLSKVTILE